jgi:hypothetical protein
MVVIHLTLIIWKKKTLLATKNLLTLSIHLYQGTHKQWISFSFSPSNFYVTQVIIIPNKMKPKLAIIHNKMWRKMVSSVTI